ncbi:hypothetical protein [Streptomyces sp. NPDC056682]|uniref:hypothetical protein n=1 Tax=Streptomyces sp. NPDC056682 TaxID=3345909 RepID=UPI003683E3E9
MRRRGTDGTGTGSEPTGIVEPESGDLRFGKDGDDDGAKEGYVGLQWAWHALALVGACRMTAAAFDAVVRRIVRTASQATAEQHGVPRTAARTVPSCPPVAPPAAQIPSGSVGGPLDPLGEW